MIDTFSTKDAIASEYFRLRQVLPGISIISGAEEHYFRQPVDLNLTRYCKLRSKIEK